MFFLWYNFDFSFYRFPQITSLRHLGQCRSISESVGMSLDQWWRSGDFEKFPSGSEHTVLNKMSKKNDSSCVAIQPVRASRTFNLSHTILGAWLSHITYLSNFDHLTPGTSFRFIFIFFFKQMVYLTIYLRNNLYILFFVNFNQQL